MNKAAFFAALRKDSRVFGSSLSQSQVEGMETILDAAWHLPVSHVAYLLGTAYHETAFTMQPITERGGRSYFNKYEPGTKIGKNLGNTVKGDGYNYRGRGFVQITGRSNYRRASNEIGVDLVTNPDLALFPGHAARILVAGCSEGWFTGRSLSNYLPGNYRDARRVVNGLDKADAIARYAEAFEAALEAADFRPASPKAPAHPDPAEKPVGGLAGLIRALLALFGK